MLTLTHGFKLRQLASTQEGQFSQRGEGSSDIGRAQRDQDSDLTNNVDVSFTPQEVEIELRSLLPNIKLQEKAQQNPCETPRDLNVDLKFYQQIGAQWMVYMERSPTRGGILADDMGLGKTVQSLALILMQPSTDPRRKATLIVCPVPIVHQWADEIEQKTQKLSVYKHYGPNRIRDERKILSYDVVVTSFSVVSCEWNESRTNGPLFRSAFHRVIVDEAHTIRNLSAKKTKSCLELEAEFRWCLTATPIQNAIDELSVEFS
ncbi:SNF2 family N-terminal domain-containing protein [Jimgerdemannia flammicorona]|uniref:SNF2 family N-terminal domain-containing protein n=1 Tax=Jimgerdemannia flammicorona TaxID=994334 RepID=A0A433BAH8_9FUNG|nr:SNF2 family N-terminal domain-containing protein [Jimgerdemannia flammicorona]